MNKVVILGKIYIVEKHKQILIIRKYTDQCFFTEKNVEFFIFYRYLKVVIKGI